MSKQPKAAYLYVGPVSTFNVVQRIKSKPTNVSRPLITGKTYDDLPEDHPVIKNMIAHDLLITPPEASLETARSDSASSKGGDDRSANAASQTTSSKGDA